MVQTPFSSSFQGDIDAQLTYNKDWVATSNYPLQMWLASPYSGDSGRLKSNPTFEADALWKLSAHFPTQSKKSSLNTISEQQYFQIHA